MTIHPDINKVKQYVKQGEVGNAEDTCKHILSNYPGHADALHYLGVIAMKQGYPERAVELIGQAIRIDSGPENFCQSINKSDNGTRRYTTSVNLDQQFARLNPDCADAYYNMGLALNRLDKTDDAITSFLKALEVNPWDYHALYNLGCVFRKQGKSEQAIDFFQKALEIEPGHSSAYNNLGVAFNEIARTEEAIACFKKARALNSKTAEVHINLGRALQQQGCVDEAFSCFEKALEVQPNDATAHYNMGVILKSRGLTRESIARFQKAVQLAPDFAEAYCSLGNLFKDKGKAEDAIYNYRRAIEIKPDYAEAYLNLGNIYQNIGKSHQTVACCRKAIELKPDFAEAYNNLGSALGNQGQFDESIRSYRKAIELRPNYAAAHSNLLFQMNYSSASNAKEMMAEANCWWRQHGQTIANQFCHQDRSDHRRHRIGYVSADFRQHSISHFFLPLLTAHDNHVVETYCYSDLDRPDDVTHRIQSQALHWRLIAGMTDADVARQIFEDQIDILVDLSGHTANNRLLVFARKPAPVQVTWMGYPGTTGLPTIDYRFTDEFADPRGDADQNSSETLVRLPHGFLCYAPNWEMPDVVNPPVFGAGHITFGSFNNLCKVNDKVIAVWSQILQRVPDSCLLLKAKQLSDKSIRNRYFNLFARNGIASDRIKMEPTTKTIPEHMRLYNKVDIGLDPFPYNGTTTTCEGLYMGVPVVTLSGERHSARVGASILSHLKLTELIATTEDDYITIATQLAKEPERLSILRTGLRQRLRSSPLGDSKSFARKLEVLFHDIWREYCSFGESRRGASMQKNSGDAKSLGAASGQVSSNHQTSINAAAIQEKVNAFPYWYHKIPLPRGVVTPGWAPLNPAAYQIPEHLDGKRVLDVGAWDGFWTFTALRRGAREVLAIDDFSDSLGKLDATDRKAWDTFDLCRNILGYEETRCRRSEISVYELDEARHGRFDIIFFFGTFYHLRYPLLALDRLASICDGEIYVESAILDDFSPYQGGFGEGYPEQMVMEFYPDNQYGNNQTNWWVPSLACLVNMLKAAGFRNCRGWKLMPNPRDLPCCRGFAHGHIEPKESFSLNNV